MAKQVNCREAGYDCDFLIRSENQEEIVELVRQHAEQTHDLELGEADVEGLIQDV